MSLVPATVVRRFLAKKAGFGVTAIKGKEVPAAIASAVDQGIIPPQVLTIWDKVVEKQSRTASGDHFRYDAAIVHWRNKCAIEGIELPDDYKVGLGGEGAKGKFGVMAGEDIDKWSEEVQRSHNLIGELATYGWELEISSLERQISKCQNTIAEHTKVIADRKLPSGKNLLEKGLAQRQKWLAEANEDLEASSNLLDQARKAVENIRAAAAQHTNHKRPTIAFEAEFQLMMMLALKEFKRGEVLGAVKEAVARFEQGLDMPDLNEKTAGRVWDMVVKVFDKIKAAWGRLKAWFTGLNERTTAINDLFKQADALG